MAKICLLLVNCPKLGNMKKRKKSLFTPLRRIWREEVQLHSFLTSATCEGKRLATRHGRFTPGGKRGDTHYTGGWVGPTARLDFLERRKIFNPTGIRTPTA